MNTDEGRLKADEYIIELFFARSEDAISSLDEKYGRTCRSISFNIVGNLDDADECVNDAYLGAWNAIPPARPNPLLTFVAKIVRNVSINRYRRNSAAKRSSSCTVALEELENCLADARTVDDEMESAELARIIEEFLKTLSLENRVIFMRRYYFSDSIKDISALTGLSEKNVSVRLARIRAKMRDYLNSREVSV